MSASNLYLALNQYAGPFTNKLVREAAAVRGRQERDRPDRRGPEDRRGGQPAHHPRQHRLTSPGYNPYPDNNGNGDPAKAKALLKQAGYPHGVTVKLLYSTTPPNPAGAQALQASLTAAGFNVSLVPVTQAAFFGSYLENPSIVQARCLGPGHAPGWIPDWFGNNGRANVGAPLHRPRQRLQLISAVTRAPSPIRSSTKALAAPELSTAAGLWSQAERQIMSDAATPRRLPEVARLPLLRGARLHFLVVRPQLRPDQRLALVVTAAPGRAHSLETGRAHGCRFSTVAAHDSNIADGAASWRTAPIRSTSVPGRLAQPSEALA